MLLILAEPDDAVAAAWRAIRTAGRRARWLTPLDLATARWTHRPGGATVATAPAGPFDLAAASGVLQTGSAGCLPVGFRGRADREYAAMERQALLNERAGRLRRTGGQPGAAAVAGRPGAAQAGWLGAWPPGAASRYDE